MDQTITSRPSLAAIGEWNRKLGDVEAAIVHRRKIASIYDQKFRKINLSANTPEARRKESAFVNYPIIVGKQRRDSFYRSALANNFDLGASLYPNVHEMQNFNEIAGRTTNISNMVRSIITLPTHVRVTPEYATELADLIAKLI